MQIGDKGVLSFSVEVIVSETKGLTSSINSGLGIYS